MAVNALSPTSAPTYNFDPNSADPSAPEAYGGPTLDAATQTSQSSLTGGSTGSIFGDLETAVSTVFNTGVAGIQGLNADLRDGASGATAAFNNSVNAASNTAAGTNQTFQGLEIVVIVAIAALVLILIIRPGLLGVIL